MWETGVVRNGVCHTRSCTLENESGADCAWMTRGELADGSTNRRLTRAVPYHWFPVFTTMQLRLQQSVLSASPVCSTRRADGSDTRRKFSR